MYPEFLYWFMNCFMPWVVAITVYSTFYVLTGVFYIFIAWKLEFTVFIIIIVIDGIIAFYAGAYMLSASLTSPGYFQKAEYEQETSPLSESPLPMRNIIVKGELVRSKYCTTCNIYRPPRSSHCSRCGYCVEKFDHHCPLIKNCIGARNYRAFFYFVFFVTIHTYIILAVSIYVAIKIHDLKTRIISIVMTMAAVGIGGYLTHFTWYHSSNISAGLTTNEELTKRYNNNPYNLGFAKNWRSHLFGPIKTINVNDHPSIITYNSTNQTKPTKSAINFPLDTPDKSILPPTYSNSEDTYRGILNNEIVL